MFKLRHIVAIFIVLTILCAFLPPVNAVSEKGVSDKGTDKQTYIIVYKDKAKAKKTDLAKAGRYAEPVDGKLKYDYRIIEAQAVELTDAQLKKAKARGDVAYVVADGLAQADLNDVATIVNATRAWSLGYTGRDVNVSVIDSGIDATHPDLQGKVILWKDFLNGRASPYDDYGHGTHVAGIIAGSGGASGGRYKGLSTGVNLFMAKILTSSGSAKISDMIAAIDWSVQNHADVISMSISTYPHYQPLDDAVHNAVESGVVMVCSAGNYGPSAGSIKCPADSPDAIAVGSYSKSGTLSSFSSRGPAPDGRVKPDLVAVGESVTSARAAGVSLSSTYNQYYTTQSGTSMSCPEVTAACALLLEADPGLTPLEVKYALLGTADRLSTVYPNNNSGWGRLNVGAALNAVLSGTVAPPVPSGTATPTPTPTPTPTATPTASPTPTPSPSPSPSPSPLPQSAWKTYVANYGGSTVSVIDQTTGTVTATITTGSRPFGVAFSPDGARAYVAVESQNKVVVIATANDRIVGNITVGSGPHGVAMAPDGRRLYVGNYGGQSISVVDTSDPGNYRVIGTIPGITRPHELWVHPDGDRLYVSTYQANTVYVIDIEDDANTVASTLTGNRPYFISVDPAGDRLFVANYNANTIQVYDAQSLALQATINTAKGPLSPIVSPDGSRLYYVTDGDNRLTIAYANNYTVIKNVACGSAVRGIACSPDGTKVYVTNMNSGTTSVVTVTDDAGTVKNVRVGSYPYGLGQFAGYYPAVA